MRVFILTTGRSGSLTFAAACSHAANYTSAHENRNHLASLRYPDDHIAINNRLAWFLPILDDRYPDAFWCFLHRDPKATAESFVRWSRIHGGHPGQLLNAYRHALKMGGRPLQPVRDALEMVTLIQLRILEFLDTKPDARTSTVRLAHPAIDFGLFWHKIRAEGDLGDALAEFTHKRNASQ